MGGCIGVAAVTSTLPAMGLFPVFPFMGLACSFGSLVRPPKVPLPSVFARVFRLFCEVRAAAAPH
eukprot:SAG31_NODE_10799_length_1096_cov_1.102307_2_plen_65_part_00